MSCYYILTFPHGEKNYYIENTNHSVVEVLKYTILGLTFYPWIEIYFSFDHDIINSAWLGKRLFFGVFRKISPYFPLWTYFPKYFKSSTSPQLTFNVTKSLFCTLKSSFRGCILLRFLHLIYKLHIYYDDSGISTKYFVWGQRFGFNLVSRFAIIIPPCPTPLIWFCCPFPRCLPLLYSKRPVRDVYLI